MAIGGELLAIEGLIHVYETATGPIPACKIPHLVVGEREFVCLVGPSGCGKTTLLQLVAGLVRPAQGRILFKQREVKGAGGDRGVVFQQPALFPWLSVRDNVAFGPRMRGDDRGRQLRIASEKLRLVGLEDFADRRPYELSGGMQQRVALARALANEPDMLLMDEPFGALDALTRDRLQEELLRVWRETRTTVLFVTHNVEEAVYLGTRVVVLSPRPGRVLLDREVPFSRRSCEDARGLRSSPDFVAAREEILAHIYVG